GARFPWESAASGVDVTPHAGRDPSGAVVPIRTGEDEIHIVGDVAWAACFYADWTGDEEFAAGPGERLLVATARYWASRIRTDHEPILIADVAARRPITADLLLGRERVRGSQVVKQADVLMLHHLLFDETAPDSLIPNLDFYEPRTAHGSSLSPAIHASLLARAGRLPEALAALQLATRIDLDDLTGTTAGGLHLATMGGVWQALAFGFAGVRARGETLELDPRVPAEWRARGLRGLCRGVRGRTYATHHG